MHSICSIRLPPGAPCGAGLRPASPVAILLSMKRDPSETSRRALLKMVPAPLGLPLLAQGQPSLARPFRVDVPQATIRRILTRVRDARWPDKLDAADWRYGANWDYMKSLAEYWTTRYDWKKAEAKLNR